MSDMFESEPPLIGERKSSGKLINCKSKKLKK